MSPHPKATEASAQKEARGLLIALETIELDRYSVAGNCLRYDERSRNVLKEFQQRLAEAFLSKSPTPKNFLLWGAPGSGKSYLVQQVAKTLPPGVNYLELNLAQLTQETLRSGLETFVGSSKPGLCFIDEVDARLGQPWPCETLLPYLESSGSRTAPTVFCLAGSGGKGLRDLTDRLQARPKGPDLLSRIPQGNQFTVAPLGVGDKILVSTAQLVLAAHDEGRSVREIERLALYFLAVHSSFRSARELRHRAAQCAQRIPVTDDRVRYDYLFPAGDPENKRFWNESEHVRKGLEDSFVRVEPGLLPPSGPAQAPEPRELRTERAPEVRTVSRIAVLPLVNISPDPKDDYFADGLTEELITVLSQIGGLRVIARTSIAQYKGTTKSVAQIGSELDVGSILEGSVRKAGNRIRVTVQLIDTQNQEHKWSQTYDRQLEDVFAIQAEVAEQTAKALRVELFRSEGEALRARPTSSLTAYEFYLRGIQAFQRLRGSENPRQADREVESHFTAAIREDPRFSAAYSRLATHLVLVSGDIRPAKDVLPRARELANRALELNPNSSEAHEAAGFLAMQADHDWVRAEREFQQALALNPSSSTVHAWYGYLLGVLQRTREAEKQDLTAIDLDPLWIEPRFLTSHVYLCTRSREDALAAVEKLMEPFGDARPACQQLAFAYAFAGKAEAAMSRLERFKGETSLSSRFVRASVLALLGNPSELRALTRDCEEGRVAEYVSPVFLARLYAELGENEKALQVLERDHSEGEDALWNIYMEYPFDSIRQDPRFTAILRSLNLPTTLARPWRWERGHPLL